MQALQWLTLAWSEDGDGVGTIEAVASTQVAHATAVAAEVARVLDWAWQAFPQGHGPLDEGHDWDHDLHTEREAQDWLTTTLTLTGSAPFLAAFAAEFQEAV
jgi:hypothetical protein